MMILERPRSSDVRYFDRSYTYYTTLYLASHSTSKYGLIPRGRSIHRHHHHQNC